MASKNRTMIAALLREREGYVRRDLKDRVRQVDEQLEHYGYQPEPDETSEPRGRTATPQQTAAAAGGDDTAKPPAKKTAAKKTTAPPPAE